MATVVVPVGANSASVKALDQNGSDVTSSCQIQAVSSDPTVIQIGTPDATTPSTIPFTALKIGAATISYTATNDQGSAQYSDTLDVQAAAPASMTVTYGTTMPQPPSDAAKAAPPPPPTTTPAKK